MQMLISTVAAAMTLWES